MIALSLSAAPLQASTERKLDEDFLQSCIGYPPVQHLQPAFGVLHSRKDVTQGYLHNAYGVRGVCIASVSDSNARHMTSAGACEMMSSLHSSREKS